jgi:hypothetical protein
MQTSCNNIHMLYFIQTYRHFDTSSMKYHINYQYNFSQTYVMHVIIIRSNFGSYTFIMETTWTPFTFDYGGYFGSLISLYKIILMLHAIKFIIPLLHVHDSINYISLPQIIKHIMKSFTHHETSQYISQFTTS